jgi:hypothetical protein
METSYTTEVLEHSQPDSNWLVQGRIIPTSVTGIEPALYMQARHRTWTDGHYHTGHCSIPAEVGLEIAMSISVPFNPKLLAKSHDFAEHTKGLSYTHMVRMLTPTETVAFITVTGLTALIHLSGVDTLFRYDNKCEDCRTITDYSISEASINRLLESGLNEKSH